jgi:hypothetical protein
MPWFPDFTSAVELARRQAQAAGRADPVAQYFTALNEGDTHVLETVWPGEVVVYDPRAGEIRGHRKLREFVGANKSLFAKRHARTETVASTVVDGRAVVELVVHLIYDGREVAWPIAVVAESPDDQSVVFRTYCSQWPVDGHLRAGWVLPRAHRPAQRPPRQPRAPLVLHHVLQRGRRYRAGELRRDRRRGALRPGVQLRPVGQP